MSEENVKLWLPDKLYRDIEKDISKLYREYDINKLPVDVFEIADKMGYELYPVVERDPIFDLLVNKDCSGLTIEAGKKKVIFYIADQKQRRQRFTIAHEIGHIRMRHREESQLADMIANHYASYLLVPEILIYLTRCSDYEDISETFCVTSMCAWNCFQSYGNWKRIPNLRCYEKSIASQFGFDLSDISF